MSYGIGETTQDRQDSGQVTGLASMRWSIQAVAGWLAGPPRDGESTGKAA